MGNDGCAACEGGRERKIWKDDKEMAQHLRLEAILTVPPPLPLPLIITVLEPASLKVSGSRQDVAAALVVEIICACKAH